MFTQFLLLCSCTYEGYTMSVCLLILNPSHVISFKKLYNMHVTYYYGILLVHLNEICSHWINTPENAWVQGLFLLYKKLGKKILFSNYI